MLNDFDSYADRLSVLMAERSRVAVKAIQYPDDPFFGVRLTGKELEIRELVDAMQAEAVAA